MAEAPDPKPLSREQLSQFLKNPLAVRTFERMMIKIGIEFDENAQDAIGQILTDSARITLVYDDDIPSIVADIVLGSIDTAYLTDNAVSNGKLRDSSGLSVIGRADSSTGDPADISGAVDQVLRVDGAATTLGFGQVATAGISDDAVTNAKLRDSAGLSVIGRSVSSSGDPDDIIAANDNEVLRRSGTNLTFGTVATAGITDDAVTDAKLRNSAALSVIGRSANSAGDPADIAGTADQVLRVNSAGTVLGFGTLPSGSLADDSVTNAKLADMAQSRVKGRAEGAGTGDPTDLTPTQVASIIDGESISWSAQQLYTLSGSVNTPSTLFSSATPVEGMDETDQASGEQRWIKAVSAKVWQQRTVDAGGGSITWMAVTRGTSTAITNIALGDTTNNNTYTFGSTGLSTFTGSISAATFIPSGGSAPTNGMYLPAANRVGISTNSTLRWDIDATDIVTTVPQRGPNGSAAAPTYSWSGDDNNGPYYIATDQWGLSANSTLQFEIGDGYTDHKTQSRWNGINSPAQIVANTNDWTGAAGNITIVRFSTDASRNITGMTAGVAGRVVWLFNIGTQPAVFTNNDAASTAGNRFLNANAGNKTINQGACIAYWYDGTSAAWRQISMTS